MNNYTALKIGQGIGDLKFGMTREEVVALIGKPDEIEQYSHSNFHDEPTEAWHYDELELSLGFDEAFGWKLVNISSTSFKAQLNGKLLFGHSQLALMNLLKSLGFHDLEVEDTAEAQQLLTSDEKSINFWLDNGELIEVQLGPQFDGNEEVIWPV